MNGEKKYYKISEISEILGVKPHVLRYWETEFPEIKPLKGPSKHRRYSNKDLEVLKIIKRLLYEEGFTIKGAKVKLKELLRKKIGNSEEMGPFIENIKARLKEIKEVLISLKEER
jgi:DNA-binding transcriptional MerR regulator